MPQYEKLSHRVIAERYEMFEREGDGYESPYQHHLVGDRFIATYTYGPLGVIMRTAELGDPDPTNNRHHFYLPDAMGGNVGLYVDTDGDPATDRVAAFNQFDAFGNPMSKTSLAVGTRGWRGQEGSMTDGDSGLVPMYIGMQSRHYDPTIGRFIQADSLSLASLTTQGMNRYVYMENDPVNISDPSGHFWWLLVGILALGVVAGLSNMATSGASTEHFINGFLGGVVSAALGMLFIWLGPYVALAALGIGLGNVLTSYLEGDLANVIAMKGGSACILAWLLTQGELASPWGVVASILFWHLFNVFWQYFTGGPFALQTPATDDEAGAERLCSGPKSRWRRRWGQAKQAQHNAVLCLDLVGRLGRTLPANELGAKGAPRGQFVELQRCSRFRVEL